MKTQEIACFKYNYSPGVLLQKGVTSFQSRVVLSEDGEQLMIYTLKPVENLHYRMVNDADEVRQAREEA